jgi:uncharacterized protein
MADFAAAKAAYEKGDYLAARKEFLAAAEQGDARAQFFLGTIYPEGQGVARDFKESVKWLRMAGEKGYADAQRALATVYLYGRGLPRDAAEAIKWYRMAAEQGDPMSQFALGAVYDEGKYIDRDQVEAYMWFSVAGAAGNESAVKYRDALAKKLTKKQLTDGKRRAQNWQAKVRK